MPRTGQGNTLRSVSAVLAGVVAIFVLSIATDVAMHLTGVYPPIGQPFSGRLCLLATAYRIVYAVAGGYITARLAPNRPMQHALIYGFVGVLLSTAGAIATWKGGPAYGPHWYAIGLIVISLPCSLLGGRLAAAREIPSANVA
jgi:hypothetical protein